MNDTNRSSAGTGTTGKGRSWAKRIALILLVLLLGLVVFIAFAPGILGGGWAKGRLTAMIDNAIEGSVKIDGISLSWFGGQRISGVQLSDPQGKVVASVESVSVESSLWALVMGGRDLGRIEVVQPMLDVAADASGQTDLQKAVTPSRPMPERPDRPAGPIALPVTFNLVLTNGKITAAKPGLEPVTFADLNATIDARQPADQGLVFDLRTTTRQGQMSGNVTVAGKVTGFNGRHEIEPDQAKIEATADVTDLPVDGIDTLAGLNGLLTEAIGRTLNLRIDTKPGEQGRQTLAARAKAANLDVDLNASVSDGLATAGGSVRYTLTRGFAAKLAGDSGAAIDADVPVAVTIDSLQAPVGAFDPAAVKAKLSATVGDGTLRGAPKLGELSWQNTSATIDTADLSKALAVEAASDFSQGGRQGKLVVDADLSNLFSEAGKPQPDKAAVDADVRVINLPVQLIDTVAGTAGDAVTALGETLNLTAVSRSEGAERITIDLAVDAPRLTAKLPLLLTDRIALQPGAAGAASLEVAPALLQKYVTDKAGYAVAVGRPVTLAIDRLDAPRPKEGEPFIQPAETTLSVKVELADVTVTDTPDAASPIGPVAIPAATLTLVGEKLDRPAINADVRVASDGGRVKQYISRNLMAKVSATTTLDGELKHGPIRLTFEGRSLLRDGRDPLQSADLAGTVSEDLSTFSLDKPAEARYVVTPELLAAEPGAATLAEPMPVQLAVAELTAPVSGFTLAKVKTKLTAAIDRAVLAGNAQIAGTAMTGLTAKAAVDGPANTLSFSADAKTQLPNQPKAGGLNVTGDLKRWLSDAGKPAIAAATGSVTAKLTDLPSAFVDALAKQGGLVTEALGESVNVDLTYAAASQADRTIDFDARSPRLQAGGAFALAEDQPLKATRPVTVDWQMSPGAYAKLTADKDNPGAAPALALTRPVRVQATLEKLIAPPLSYFGEPAEGHPRPALDPAKLAAVGSVTLSQVALKHNPSGALATADNLKLTLDGPTLERVKVTAAGAFQYTDPKAPDQPAAGKLDAVATLGDLFNAQGMSIDADATLKEMPVAFVDAVKDLDGLAVAALGRRLNVKLTTKLVRGDGTVALTADSENSRADMAGSIRDGTLTFSKPLTAELPVSPELGEKLLVKINPIFQGAKTADQPLRLTVPAEGVSVPLREFGLAKLRVPTAVLELGRMNEQTRQYELGAIQLDTGSLLGGLVRFAQRFGALKGRNTQEMTLKFTPAVIKLDNGRIDYLRRLDVLLDESFHLVTWGYVQLDTTPDDGNDDSQVRTYLGIAGRTLDNAFGLDGVSDEEMFKIPVKGTVGKAEADWGAAAADMGTLQAQYRLLKGNPLVAAAARKLVDQVFNKGGVAAPAPSVQPLPWTIQRKADQPPADQQADQPKPDQPPAEQPKKDESLEEKLIKEGLKQIFR